MLENAQHEAHGEDPHLDMASNRRTAWKGVALYGCCWPRLIHFWDPKALKRGEDVDDCSH